MKVAAIADIHGFLPTIPECDLFIISGDICPVSNHNVDYQVNWLNSTFRSWMREVPAKCKVICAGNHDFCFEQRFNLIEPDGVYHLLQDSYIHYEGLKIYGTPWNLWFGGWAFNLHENKIEEKWAKIPDDTNILVLHQPPYGYGDKVYENINNDNEEKWPNIIHVGSTTLVERLTQLKQLKLATFGHIHSGRGEWRLNDVVLANVAVVDESYKLKYGPIIIEI